MSSSSEDPEPTKPRRSATTRLVAWLPVAMVVALFVWAYYVYVFIFCGSLVKDDVQRVVFGGVFHLLLLLCIWSFVQTTVTSVAPIPRYFSLSESDERLMEQCADDDARRQFLEILADNRGVLTRGSNGVVRFCDTCKQVKPDRAHHCSQCKRCIPKMDHHCPWFNNCVCFSTYKFFLLTIFYVVVLSVFGLLSATHHVAGLWSDRAASSLTLHATLLYLFGLVLSLSLGSFLYFHITMVCSNVTTLEDLRPHQFKDRRDSFDVGCCNNIAEVFGRRKALWLLPVFTALGDGTRFPTRLHPDRNVYGPPASVAVEARRPSVPVPPATVVTETAAHSRMPPVVGPPSCRYPVPSSESVALTLSPPLQSPRRGAGRGGHARLPPMAITIVPSRETPASQLHSANKKDATSSVAPPMSLTSVDVR
ncbi:palmitoyltransferase ZDHHC15A-like [Dermacentor albipictus]|uniref:palmitoyltransferase ZDHHC15A-like n=1 Tax=Dermacentor albipictus TaxID=60249 RepID=UPI0038FCF0E3